MANQNLTDEQLERFMLLLLEIVSLNDSSRRIFDLFGAFVCMVADDYPERTTQYLDALKQVGARQNPYIRLVK